MLSLIVIMGVPSRIPHMKIVTRRLHQRLKFTHSCFLFIVPDPTCIYKSTPFRMCGRYDIEIYMIALNLNLGG
jgi:uncharacterized membrane protein YhaH (DUF805 family)